MEIKMKESSVQIDRDPLYELFDIIKEVLYAPDCLRALVLFSLSYLTLLNLTFFTYQWYESSLAGVLVNLNLAIGNIILMLIIPIVSLISTCSLITMTWERMKKEYPALLTAFMNRLIVLMCIYIAVGYVTTSIRLSGEIITNILFYGISIVLADYIGQLKQAKREVRAYDQFILEAHQQ